MWDDRHLYLGLPSSSASGVGVGVGVGAGDVPAAPARPPVPALVPAAGAAVPTAWNRVGAPAAGNDNCQLPMELSSSCRKGR